MGTGLGLLSLRSAGTIGRGNRLLPHATLGQLNGCRSRVASQICSLQLDRTPLTIPQPPRQRSQDAPTPTRSVHDGERDDLVKVTYYELRRDRVLDQLKAHNLRIDGQ